MNAYTAFAYVYDEYMDNIPYDEWGQYMIGLLKELGVKAGDSVVDLGCGTGTVTRMLEKEGYDIVGIDMSEDMLAIAAERIEESGQDILYSCQDMREFELPFKVDAFTSIGDSMNYITSKEDLESVFKCVAENINDGGVFVFDLKTIHFFRDILADNTYAENRDESAFIWDNYYNDDDKNNEYDLAVFVMNEDGSFNRYEEQHFQHGFELEEVKEAAANAGLSVLALYDAFSKDAPKPDSERVYFVLQK
ncbi:class I SAM-dependent DNA methyltransferase [Lachnospira pectinoschiza]|uniref:Methyltransferase domain-containing protein n=1 Tax=Lachnospira pectinoschiza TaxID=28052 RepID=A0A1G9ZLG6_9FIRM|nr:class I SAM-dependent methyltransferase [Lachnospira pectinoschiza]MBQ2472783.1 class I SAM-dependent methyltransferase [Lachnospira sp.]SDN21831.1 Methyltransferase domain-containing protein [Lachnospira pectinoschiza]